MASVTGGRWVFSVTGQPVVLGINNGVAPVFPSPQGGAFNIEVFTNPTVASGAGIPSPDAGFQASMVDGSGTLDSGFLTGTSLRLGSGNFLAVDSVTGSNTQSPSKIALGTGNQTVVGAQNDTLVGGTSNAAASNILSALLGHETVVGGVANATSIWGGAFDSITGGTGSNQQIVVSGSGATVTGGLSGNATITAASGDTILSLGGSTQNMVIGAGTNDVVNLTGNTGTDGVIGATGDTVTGGGGTTNVDASAGNMRVQVGAAGQTNMTGSTSTVAGNTVLGGGGNLDYNPGSVAGAGDLIDLTNETGNATINTFSFGTTRVVAPDTIRSGTGNDSVFIGTGDRVGMTGGAATVGGSHQWVHGDTVSGAAGFGTFDSVAASSSAHVTVGSFNASTDFIFYQNENTTTTNQIIASASNTTVGGNAAVQFQLPDGTTMTIIGLSTTTLTPTLFKP